MASFKQRATLLKSQLNIADLNREENYDERDRVHIKNFRPFTDAINNIK